MGLLQGRVVIVTGSSSGIGLATATQAIKEGAQVFGVDISTYPPSLADEPSFRFFQCDLTTNGSSRAIVQACLEAYGEKVDALFNIAGVMDNHGSVDTLTNESWERCLAVNLTAPVELMREVIPIMRREKSGSIVNLASKAGTSGAASGVAYTASKHGLIGATKNVAWRYKDENIRCNAVCPGGVLTPMRNSSDPTTLDFEALASMRPVHSAHMAPEQGPYIKAEEIATTIVFLASDSSLRINGAVVPIDNAWSTI
ncbi:hypothetical protein PENARI_c010G01937 [Penicillium arizonense]|uniref:Uncharacterized protein n=1 Tax=Penicillium arizonense TaxID=1835702 RepID=A0A1F5LGN3_PENAI|nr:hypothetical protein PENARI_c010G01937 [Penicillium arizonense]OGE52373.1 hypothetical protein PENARI_c010G01937 [Penicillium arizonense]